MPSTACSATGSCRPSGGCSTGPCSAALLGSLKHPLILVDWSPIDAAGTLFLLLEALAAMLPARCTPLLVTDASFRRPWFQAVEAMGWHYVGRVRNRDLCRFGEQPWQPVKSLYALVSASPKRLGRFEMTCSAPWSPHSLRGEACAAGAQASARHRNPGPGQTQPAKRAARARALAAGQQSARGAVECRAGRGDLGAVDVSSQRH
ncbi:Transposase, IS4 family (plasmid) [Azotobacter chroococcum NCIMB 8003]|uniref:Transposase, IS4 family n=1 Tax=Azotobacter chroococcum NCIMB 8003 TaxID=1328314 RepID=A0A0C4WSH0_9GAMM|nr:Transposase, IS4 family [Azotobacter chroococcum NCIMB 8003]